MKRDAADRAAPRADTWENLITGLNVLGRDPVASTKFAPAPPLDAEAAAQLYEGDDVASTIVDALPKDGTREPAQLVSDDPQDAERLVAAQDLAREHKLHEKLLRAAIWGRATGGAAVLLTTDDGELETPLNLEAVTALKSALYVDRRALWVESYDLDGDSTTYGEPLTFRFWPASAGLTDVGARPRRANKIGWGTVGSVVVHRSRLVLFGGAITSRRTSVSENQGWDDSVLRKVLPVLRQVQHTWQSVPVYTRNLAQAVMKIAHLRKLLAAGGEEDLRRRLRLVELSREAGVVAIDASEAEDFKFEAGGSGGGIVDILVQNWQRLALAADMPVTRLMGMSPAGLNATGESDARSWYDRVKSWQLLALKPAWEQVLDVVFQVVGEAPKSWEVKFPPLWQPTDKEQAETYKTVSEADQAMVSLGAVTPEEAARGHFSPQGFRVYPQVDLSRFDKQEAEPAGTLNGSQVESLLKIVQAATSGQIARESAVAMISAAFALNEERAAELAGPEDFKSTPPAAPGAAGPPLPGGAGGEPLPGEGEPAQDEDLAAQDEERIRRVRDRIARRGAPRRAA